MTGSGSAPELPLLLALDQGTTSTRAILFDRTGTPVARARRELSQGFPAPGRVEHDPDEIWEDTLQVAQAAMGEADVAPRDVAGVGITNQRETTLVWERESGRPVHPAIVWQDRRTADMCRRLKRQGVEPLITRKTGLLLDPYFSATKLAWMLENVEGLRTRADRGELAFGTVDTWLLWKLTGGRVHATDVTNASRTLLYDLREGRWDPQLLDVFDIPASLLPEVRDSAGHFGEIEPDLLGAPLPVLGIAGDQQAATFGQAAFEPGTVKATYGTGGFLLLNTGREPVGSRNRLLSTVAWRLEGESTFALEGSIFSVGSAVQWLRDGLGVLSTAEESADLAASLEDNDGVYLVPAFTGLGAPYWDSDARGSLTGLTRNSGPAHLARAALEAVAYQTRDLMEAMESEEARQPTALRVDGGLSRNDWAMSFLADMLNLPVERPEVTETTALGAAYLAGLAAGLYRDLDEIAELWRRDRRWEPGMPEARRDRLFTGWRDAVRRTLTGGGSG